MAARFFMEQPLSPFIFKKMAPSFSTLPVAEINARTNHADIETIRKVNNRQQSGHGFITDMSQTDLSTNVLSNITCPTLIMHSKYDGSVSIKHAYHAHKNIPASQLCMLDSWGHLIWLSETFEEVDQALISFIKSNNN